MKEEYINNINTQKEVLAALPQNNLKNTKIYQEKIAKLLADYEKDLILLTEEIVKRKKQYLQSESPSNLSSLEEEITSLKSKKLIISPYTSPYEKSGLDIILYKLGHYYTIDLTLVNENIQKALNIFKKADIILTSKDFTYSFYANKYLEKILSISPDDDTYKEELKQSFEDIYWKCPDIINHITLNFKHLYYLNEKKFIAYYEKEKAILSTENIPQTCKNLIIQRDNIINESKYLLINKIKSGEINSNDYTKTKINKIIEELIPSQKYQEEDLISLYHTLEEYKIISSLDYLINDLKALLERKNEYKDIYLKQKKEIIKKEKELFKQNNKINKLIIKNDSKKFDYYNNLTNNNILLLKNMYEELEKDYFLEKLSKLSEDATILDFLSLASSNYNYLIELFKQKEKNPEKELTTINNIINSPYLNLINNLWITDEKNISLIIIDKYNLYNFKLTKDMLEEENISTLIQNIKYILTSIQLKKHNLDEDKIKFIKDSENIN